MKRDGAFWAGIVGFLWIVIVGVSVTAYSVMADSPRRGDPKPVVTWGEMPGDYTEVSGAMPVPVDAVASALSVRLEFIKAVAMGRMAHPTWGDKYWSVDADGNLIGHYKQQYTFEEAWAMADDMAMERIVTIADALLRAAGE